jgi:uncharacterized protein (TIGR03437 family)
MKLRVLALLLCCLSVVTATGFLFDRNSHVGAAQYEGIAAKQRPPSVKNLSPLVSFNNAGATRVFSEDGVWRKTKEEDFVKSLVTKNSRPHFASTLTFDVVAQNALLRRAPMEFTKAARDIEAVMTLPLPDGTFARFRIEESPVLAPELAAQFPAIKTYRGRGLDDPTAVTRFDTSPAGFHAIVLSAGGTFIIEPGSRGRAGEYVSYNQDDAQKDAGASSCLLFGADQSAVQFESKQPARHSYTNRSTSGVTALRTYRLALAATAEFTQVYGGGTVAGALSAMTTTINAVNAIYERDLGIHLVLVTNESSIIFTNAATDGYTSDDANSLINQNQVILDQRIGSANYDVGMVLDGHVYAYQPGHFIFQGAAQYQSVCRTGRKGIACSIFRSTEPSTITAITVVAHELGHQFGALHTFNGTLDDCGPSRFAEMAYEPGSGSTIMGYRGGFLPDGTYYPLCSTEDLAFSGTYFHTATIEQIQNYTTFGVGGSCPVVTASGNNAPDVDAGPDHTIPANTPFTLMAIATDLDADALSYCWEEFDLGAAGPPHTDNGDRPIFRSFGPAPSPARTFPQLADILTGTPTFGESLPTTTRSMNFRVTVRDNHSGAGGVSTAGMRVNVSAGSGPFAVLQPDAATTWTASSHQTVTWDVANTSSSPVSCANVRVLLSIDGGFSFPYTLASMTPNAGTATISVPNTPTSSARIKVEAIGNIFFSISLPNFSIIPNNTSPPTLLTEANTNRAVALDSVMFLRDPFTISTGYNFSFDQRTRVMLFAVGLELMPGEDASVVTVQAEDSEHKIYPFTVEYVGKVPDFDWLTQVNVRLPDGLPHASDVLVSISLRGASSNKALMGIR